MSTGYKQTVKIFGNKPKAELNIPNFINKYNL